MVRALFASVMLLPLVAGATARSAGAQTNGSAMIFGIVRDSAGMPIENAQVLAVGSDGSFTRRSTSDARGAYRVRLLPPGRYDLTVQRIGYRPAITRNIILGSNGERSLDVTLRGQAVDLSEVVVRADAPVALQRGAELGATRVTAADIAALPVGTDAERLVAMSPGARGSSLWGASGAAANSYQLDGMAILDPGAGGAYIQPSVRWIESLEIKGLGADAEEGNFQGGVVNVITKSGSNTLHGSLELNLEDRSLNGSNLTRTTLAPEIADRRQIIGQLSGPLVRNRLFYYLGGELLEGRYQAIDHVSGDTSALAPFLQSRSDLRLFGKLTLTPSTRDLINVGVTRTRLGTEHGDFSGRETIDATTDLSAPVTLGSASWQRLLGSQTTLELRALAFEGTERRDAAAGANVPGIYTYQLTTTRSFQNAPFSSFSRARSRSGALTLDTYRMMGKFSHHVRLGGELNDATWRNVRSRNGGMTWRPRYSTIDGSARSFDPTNASTWQTFTPSSWGGEVDLATHTVNAALFVQDEIKSGHVTLHPGLRLGRWAGDLDPTEVGVSSRTRVLADMAIDPRLGITITVPDPTTPTRFAAHLGRYHQSVFAGLFDRAQGANAYSDQQVWEYLGPSFTDPRRVITRGERDALVAAGEFRQIENVVLSQSGPIADYRQPYVDQMVAGFDVRPTRHWRGEFMFVGRNNRNLVALVDRNIGANYKKFDNIEVLDRRGKAVLDSDGDPLKLQSVYIPKDAIARLLLANREGAAFPVAPGIVPADVNGVFDPDYVVTNPPEAKRQFRQWQLTVDAEYPRWSGSLSAVFTGLNGNFSTITGYDPLSVGGREGIEGRGAGPFVRPNESINFEGGLDNASFLTFKWRLAAELPFGFRGGLLAEYISGDQLTPTFVIVPQAFMLKVSGVELPPILTEGISRNRIYTKQQGSLRYKGRSSLDLHLEKGIARRAANVTISADAFNVLGQRNVTLRNVALGSDADPNAFTEFGSPLAYQPPRQLRLGAGVAW